MPIPRSLASFLSYKGAEFREKVFLDGFRKTLNDEGVDAFLGTLRRPTQRDPFVVDALLEAFGERFPTRRIDAAQALMSGWVDQPGVTGMASAVERTLKKMKAKEREELARWIVADAKGDWRQG